MSDSSEHVDDYYDQYDWMFIRVAQAGEVVLHYGTGHWAWIDWAKYEQTQRVKKKRNRTWSKKWEKSNKQRETELTARSSTDEDDKTALGTPLRAGGWARTRRSTCSAKKKMCLPALVPAPTKVTITRPSKNHGAGGEFVRGTTQLNFRIKPRPRLPLGAAKVNVRWGIFGM
jgi:hypothetical protein